MRLHSHIAIVCLTALLWAAPASAQTLLDALQYSPDVTAVLGGVTLNDEDTADDDRLSTVTPLDLGMLPPSADLTAFAVLPSGERLLAFDTTVVLDGATFTPRDVARFDGMTYVIDLDGEAAGLPPGSAIDALAVMGEDSVLFSLDVDAMFGETFVADEDLAVAMTNDAGGIDVALFFDGDGNGIDPTLDLDGAHLLANGNLLLSFDGSGMVGEGEDKLIFDDEDALEFNPMSLTFLLAYDGSAEQAGWPAADLDALAATETVLAGGGGGGGVGGGGGGCAMHGSKAVDPLLPLLLLLAGLYGLRRRVFLK